MVIGDNFPCTSQGIKAFLVLATYTTHWVNKLAWVKSSFLLQQIKMARNISSPSLRLLRAVLCIASFVYLNGIHSFNIDTSHPIFFSNPDNQSKFGFSLALHRQGEQNLYVYPFLDLKFTVCPFYRSRKVHLTFERQKVNGQVEFI